MKKRKGKEGLSLYAIHSMELAGTQAPRFGARAEALDSSPVLLRVPSPPEGNQQSDALPV